MSVRLSQKYVNLQYVVPRTDVLPILNGLCYPWTSLDYADIISKVYIFNQHDPNADFFTFDFINFSE